MEENLKGIISGYRAMGLSWPKLTAKVNKQGFRTKKGTTYSPAYLQTLFSKHRLSKETGNTVEIKSVEAETPHFVEVFWAALPHNLKVATIKKIALTM